MPTEQLSERTLRRMVATGLWLKSVRKAHGVSLTEFAKRMGMDKSNYRKIEQGKKNLTLATFVAFFEALDSDFVMHEKGVRCR